jgi:hypothetical protein
MRTTIRLPDDLLAAAKRRAAETHRSLTAVIEDALRQALSRKPGPRRGARTRLPTFAGDGLLPGIHLEDGAELLDLMEDGAAPR